MAHKGQESEGGVIWIAAVILAFAAGALWARGRAEERIEVLEETIRLLATDNLLLATDHGDTVKRREVAEKIKRITKLEKA